MTVTSVEPLGRALRNLEAPSRALIELSFRSSMSTREIAETLDVDPTTVGVWQSDALLHVATDLGLSGPAGTAEVRAQLEQLPDDEWVGRPSPRRERGVARSRPLVVDLLLLAVLAALLPARGTWVAEAVGLIILLVVPGRALLRALRVPGDAVLAFPAYIPCASLVVLLAAGLGVDLIGMHSGKPLRTGPLLVGVETISVALLVAGVRAPATTHVRWSELELRLRRMWPLLLPLLAAAGAVRLNNGYGPAVAIVAMAAAVAVLVVAAWRADRISRSQLSLVLYGVSLAACWSFSLRSRFVYGWDISTELHVFASTWHAGVWHPAHPNDSYGAMLSLTILPSMLHAIAGVPVLAVFKVVYPALFALFPVALFGLAARFLRRQYAFVAAAFIVVQNYFFQQLPGLARQEIGLLLFIALIAATLHTGMRRRAQWPLIAAFAFGVAVSHYSTTYLAAAVLVAAVVLQLIVSVIRRARRVSGALAAAAIATVAAAAVWYAPVTHSSQNVSSFSSDLSHNGVDLLPNASGNILQSYLSGNSQAQIPASRYARIARREYAREHPAVRPLANAGDPAYRLRDAKLASAPRSAAAATALQSAQAVIAQLANVLAAIGAIALALRRRSTRLARQLGFLALAMLLVLAFLRLSGTAAKDYNQERAFVQSMVPLSVAMAWVLELTGQRVRRIRRGLGAIVACCLGVVFLVNVGVSGVALGSGAATNLATHGEDYERFYVTPPELSAANWLTRAPRAGFIYADRYGELRILAATGSADGLLADVTPLTLDQHAWVYASSTNVVTGHARGGTSSDNRYAIYAWPARFLDDNYDTVYTNGVSRVYHR
jgi:uncharacterized membrane protein